MSRPKRVFIAMHYLEIGGAESALIGLLDAWDYDRAEVDLFIYAHRGELMRHIPERVNLLPEIKSYSAIEIPAIQALRHGCFGVVAGRWLAKRTFARYARTAPKVHTDAMQAHIGRCVTPFLPAIGNGVYDLAISWLTPHHQVLKKVKARRKVAWIHTDYSYIPTDRSVELPMWAGFDRIISISPAVTESFCSQYPELRNRISEIENIMPVQAIRRRALESVDTGMSPDHFDILSVGRYAEPKNFESIPGIMRRMIELTGRDDLRWHIIGYGGGEALVRSKIAEMGMENHVILHGKQANPYPFMAACDLYVQPSRYEGKSVCVREAQALNRPVVISNYSTARSQLIDGIDGLIFPLDSEELAKGIARVINDQSLRHNLAAECAKRDYSNRSEVEKVYSLIPD